MRTMIGEPGIGIISKIYMEIGVICGVRRMSPGGLRREVFERMSGIVIEYRSCRKPFATDNETLLMRYIDITEYNIHKGMH